MFGIKPFYETRNVTDAVNTLVESPDIEVISGGTGVLIRVKKGKDTGRFVISIHNIEALKGIRLLDNGGLWIGVDTASSHITNNVLTQRCISILGDTVDIMDGPQIRDAGIIGDNTCNGATLADSTSTIWTLKVDVLLEGPEGRRTASVCEFYTGSGRTIRQRVEVHTGFLVYRSSIEGWSGHYIKYDRRKTMEIATLGYAVHVKLSRDREWIEDVKLGYSVAGPTPLRCREAEHGSKRRVVNDRGTVLAFGRVVLEEVNPRFSRRVSKEFRLQLVEKLPKWTLAEVIRKTGGMINV